jgi:gliding motility-associated lipoprotein GldH
MHINLHERYLMLLATTLCLLASCDRNRVYEKNISIENQVWNYRNVLEYPVTITDAATPCNFYLNIRNTNRYRFSNLFLFIETHYPDGKMSRDTVECVLADPGGRWLGKGLGSIRESRILLRKNVLFPWKGDYLFRIEQAMRVDDLEGIQDMGIRIEKAAPPRP